MKIFKKDIKILPVGATRTGSTLTAVAATAVAATPSLAAVVAVRFIKINTYRNHCL